MHWCVVMLEKEGAIPKLLYKVVGNMNFSNMSWYAKLIRVPFTGTKEPSLTP